MLDELIIGIEDGEENIDEDVKKALLYRLDDVLIELDTIRSEFFLVV